MKTILSLFLGLFVAASAMADSFDSMEVLPTARLARPLEADVSFSENDFNTKPWIREFRYVLVVNKANSGKDAQTLKMFENGQLIKTRKISTGREQFERKGVNHSKADAWTVTPSGFYTPDWLSKDHKSSAYGTKLSFLTGGTRMPYAIFFNGGVAFHEVLPKSTGSLGKRASGGCVRLPTDTASDLFYRIQETSGAKNPVFNVYGEVKKDVNGNIVYNTKSGYSALIIVINKIVE